MSKNVTDMLHEFTDEDLEKLHSVLLEMYTDIQRVCEKYNLKPILCGGSALGAVRHHGFIPWDDDMDFTMLRPDYNKFEEVFDKELGDKYYLYAPNRVQGCRTYLPRLMKKNTTLLDIRGYNAEYHNGIWIDINIMEFAPKSRMKRRWASWRADCIRVVGASVHWYMQRSRFSDEYYKDSKSYKVKLLIGKMMSFHDYQYWYNKFDKYVSSFSESDVVTIPSGRNYYWKEIHPKEVFFPPKKEKFENIEVYVPHDYDGYLRALYGDSYMQLPPENKRERHKIMCFDTECERSVD